MRALFNVPEIIQHIRHAAGKYSPWNGRYKKGVEDVEIRIVEVLN
jgi:hypothetical protein